MIDVTTMVFNPIPSALADLEIANSQLSKNNNLMKNIIIGAVVIGGVYLIIHYYKKQKINVKQPEK